jgi:hypothetical protein
MPSIAIVCLVSVAIALSSLKGGGFKAHRSAERTQVVAQYCMPVDDYPDADRLYC